MLGPVDRNLQTGQVNRKEPVKAEAIKAPKGMENIAPNSKIPKGVKLAGRTKHTTSTTKTTLVAKRQVGRGPTLLSNASLSPPQSDDELDALATLFKQRDEKTISGSKTPAKAKKARKRTWSESPGTQNLGKIAKMARHRLTERVF